MNMTPISELQHLVASLKDARVLVLGDLMLDTYLMGDAARISPEAPVPVVKLKVKEHRLGGAANTAMNVAALGGEPLLVGAIGADESGEQFMNLVREHGFDGSGVIADGSVLTTRKVRVVAAGQQIVRIDEEEHLELSEELEDRAIEFVRKSLPNVGALAVSDYAKGFITPRLMTAVHDLCRLQKVPILVDPKPVNVGLYKGVDLLKPNRKETSELSGIDIVDNDTCDAAARFVMEEFSPKALLVTRGPDGMDLYREGNGPVRIRAKVSRVYDVSGAGDTVLSTLAVAYAKGVDPVSACELAAAAAAVVVTKPGTSVVTQEELLEAIRE